VRESGRQSIVGPSSSLGLWYENTFASEQNGVPLADSGASGVFVHPGIVFSVNPALQFFGLVSLPVTQQWSSIIDTTFLIL
jgi:hypothetical protein